MVGDSQWYVGPPLVIIVVLLTSDRKVMENRTNSRSMQLLATQLRVVALNAPFVGTSKYRRKRQSEDPCTN